MAPKHTITQVTDLTTLQELANVSKAAENYSKNSLGKMWPARKVSTMTLGKFYHLSPATASNFRREATACLAKATTKTSTVGKNKATSISLKRTSTSLKRVSPKLTSTNLKRVSPKLTFTSLKRASTEAKRLTSPRKRAPTFKHSSTEIEGHSTAMVATTSTKDVSMSTKDLVATQDESTMTEAVAPMTQDVSASTRDGLVSTDAATMTERAHSKTSDASTMTEDIFNTLKKPISTEINPTLSGISSSNTILSSNQYSQERFPQEKKDSQLMAPEVTLGARKATPVLIDLTSSTNYPLSINKQHGTDKSSSTVTVVRNVSLVRSSFEFASLVPTVSRADKEPKLPEKPQPKTILTRATPTVPFITESPVRKARITAELKRREQDKTSPYQQATCDMIKRDANAGLRKEFISYRNHTISTEAIREQTTAAKRKRETNGDPDDKAMTTNTQNKRRKGLATMNTKVIAVSVLGLAVALSTAPASVPDWFPSIPLKGIVLPLRHHLQSSAPPGDSDWLSSMSALLEENVTPSLRRYLQPPAARLLDWPRWPTRKDPRA
ncbi:hypothetical protein BGZ59_010264 [Podila verticillata]|nr:hypothetical protein BGZ59_010264 [Podila verticillata]